MTPVGRLDGSAARRLSCWAARLLGCWAARRLGCRAARLLGGSAAGRPVCWAARLLGGSAAGLLGGSAARAVQLLGRLGWCAALQRVTGPKGRAAGPQGRVVGPLVWAAGTAEEGRRGRSLHKSISYNVLTARTGGTGATGPGGAPGAGATGGAGAGGAAGVGAPGGTGAGAAVSARGPAGARAAGGTGAVGAAGVGADAGGTGVVPAGSRGATRPRPYFVPLLETVLGLPPSSSPAPSLECPPPVQSESQFQLVSPVLAPSPYASPTGGLAERREPESRPASPVHTARTSRRVPRPRPPAVPGTHQMALRPSTAPQRVPLPSPPESSLPALADLASDSLRAASPTVTRFLATVVTDPSFESTAASALVTKLVDFAAHCRLDYAASLVADSASASVCPPYVGDEVPPPDGSPPVFKARYVARGFCQRQGVDYFQTFSPTPKMTTLWAAMDAEMASWKSTGTYVDEVPPPDGSPPVFKARYVARGFCQRQGVDYFQTFSPTPKMTTLWVLLHVAAQRDYELHSLDFSTAFLRGSLHEEIWLRRPPAFTGSFPAGTQWSLRRPVYGLRQTPRKWDDTLRTTLAALGFAPSIADPSLFLRTDTLLPPFYILVYVDDLVFATVDTAGLAHVKSELQKRHTCTDLGELRSYLGLQITRDRARRTITLTHSHMLQQVLQRFDFTYSSPQATPLSTRHSLSALPSDESVEPSGPYPELVGCLMYLMTCTRPDLAYPLGILARYVAPGRHRPEHMAAAKRVLRYLCSTLGLGLVLGGRSPVVLTGHADASWVDDLGMQRLSQGYTFSLGSGSVSWRSTRSSSVLSSSCEAEIYAGDMAAQELRWLTYLLTDLGEQPRSPPVLYVDNKAMLALCLEHRLEHRTKHIALCYFLARELQQRGQLRLAYVASQANTADIFTKALQPCDHQRFCTMLVPSLTSSSPCGQSPKQPPQWVIRVILRDSHGIAQVSGVTGSKVLRILKAHGLAPEIPEDLYHLIKKALAVRKHLERNRKDKDSKFRLILIESRVHHLSRYYKWTKKLPPNWKYNAQVGAGGTAAAGEVGAGNPVTAFTVKRGKKWRTGVTSAKKAGGGHPAASPAVTRLLATVVTDPSFESAAPSAFVTELVDFAAYCRLDYTTRLVAESESVCPPSVGDPDAPDIPTPRSYAEAIEGPYSSQWQAAMDAEMASWKSTGTYVDEVPPPGANIVSGMWIFRVKQSSGSLPVFKARYVARGFCQRQGVEYLQTFFPTPKMTNLWGSLHEEIWLRCPPDFTGSFPPGTQWSLWRPVYGLRQAPREWHDTLRTTLAALGFAPSTADPSLFVRTDTSLPPFYILVYVDDLVFATAETAGLAHVKSELQKRHTCTDLGELRSYLGLQITRDRAQRTITLTQSHMVQQVLQRFGFMYSSPQATPLSTRHSLSALPSDESVEPSGPYPELVGCLMYLMSCTRPDLAYPLSILARYVAPGRHRPEHMAAAKRVLRYLCSTSGFGLVLGGRSPVVLTGHADPSWVDDLATQRSSQGYTFSLGSGSISWRSTRSSSVLSSSCEAEIYAGAMAAQELRWLTYLLTDLGEPPRSPPVLYVDNKAMLALCREHRLEHRTKHIALRYFLARELQQRGQLRLAYVVSEANTTDIFTKALQPCDHQHFCTMLGLVPTWPHLLTS
ncbi:unnamed protein product [Closterium sp. NIES-54]